MKHLNVKERKKSKHKLTMLTAYDYPTAMLMDRAGIDMVLVGDSLANVVLGLNSTADVGMTEMLHHAKAVRRAVKNAMVIGDMPFEAYQIDIQKAVANAKLFIDEAGCDAVKLEWFDQGEKVARAIVQAGIAVVGHVGLTPQTAASTGGMKVQGKDASAAAKIIDQAKALQEAGCFALVLECIPKELARIITDALEIPTIGIGAGPHCDGQVLVSHDLLGLFERYQPKFTKKYVDLGPMMVEAFKAYKQEVENGSFPDEARSFHMPPDELKKIV